LAAAVEPFTLEHAAGVADVDAADLTELLAAVRRAGRLAVVTGTGVTMSISANVTHWLAWVLMILTGSMNRPGGVWFHPGFSHQLEAFELPVSPLDGLFGPEAAQPSGVAGLLPRVAMRAGAMSIPHGHKGANVNVLTCKDQIDLPTGMAQYSGIPVNLHPASNGS
jgi:anaerobic selenocysteine-containing dehydrogenase